MPRLNMGLALGGVAAVAVGIIGGWALLAALSVAAPATVETASVLIATTPSPDQSAPFGRTPARAATPSPAPAVAPAPAPPTPPRNAAPTKDEPSKPHIHLDGERSAFSYVGAAGGLYIYKDRLSVRSPFGTFDIDW